MLSGKDLRELLDYSAPSPVLSIYLNTDPVEGNADAYKLRLRSMLKDLSVGQDETTVQRFLDHEYDWSGRSIALFSSHEQGFFRAYPLAVQVQNLALVGDKPYVKPLVDLMDSYGAYGVVLVDRQGARVFLFHLGELKEQEGVLGEIVKHTKRGGASTFPGRRGGVAGQTRYTEEVIDRNMKSSVDFAVRFFEENRIRRILIGGTDDNVALFKSLLPKTWQSLVVGIFPMSMAASHTEVQARAIEAGAQAMRQREDQIIDTTITAAAKLGNGVVGLDDTLRALHEGRVQTLLISSGYRDPGYHCVGCGFMTGRRGEGCPFCGNKLEEITDAVELAVQKVIKGGGDVEVIHHHAAFDKAGRIGALLRY